MIQQLNDQHRKNLLKNGVTLTQSVRMLNASELKELIQLVQDYDNFTEDNDPHKEHDFGSIEFKGTTYFWKFDYYDLDLEGGIEDPSDPSITKRVLTLMEADEY